MSVSPSIHIGPWIRCYNGSKYTKEYACGLAETEFKERLFCPHEINDTENHYFMPNRACSNVIDLPDLYESYAIPLQKPLQLNPLIEEFPEEYLRLQALYGQENVFLEWGIWNWVS